MKCRLCGNNNLTLYYTQGNENQFKFYKCRHCKLVNYDLSTGQDQNKYSGEKYIDPDDDSQKTNKDQSDNYRFINKKLKRKGRLLDIGCGNGKLLLLAKDDGWDVKGLELSKFLADSIKKKYMLNVAVSDFLTYKPAKDDQYDIVVLHHVLEHLPDSILAMKKINALLNPRAYAVLSFPDIEGYELKIKRCLLNIGLRKKKYKNNYKPGHSNEFCKESFTYLLDKTGFELIKWQHYSSKSILNIFYKLTNFGSKVRVLIRKK
jgi:2-polyprenyl-3-methyl-5-hydroxy-6-metoxy-1,4-benzoquinol methylase